MPRKITKKIDSKPLDVVQVPKEAERIIVIQNFDLRGITPKVDEVTHLLHHSPIKVSWVAFVNKAGNLCHIMHVTDIDSYVRQRWHKTLRNCHPDYIRKMLHERMVGKYLF